MTISLEVKNSRYACREGWRRGEDNQSLKSARTGQIQVNNICRVWAALYVHSQKHVLQRLEQRAEQIIKSELEKKNNWGEQTEQLRNSALKKATHFLFCIHTNRQAEINSSVTTTAAQGSSLPEYLEEA